MTLVLDTNVARKIAAGDLNPSGLVALRRSGAKIHLADTALAELSHQLQI
jgi:hypothetical protein